MAVSSHTYGAACELRRSRRKPTSETPAADDHPPPLTARFFYASRWHVDDSSQFGHSTRLLPFSELDNARLEAAWRHYARSILGLRGNAGGRKGGAKSGGASDDGRFGVDGAADTQQGHESSEVAGDSGPKARPRSKDEKAVSARELEGGTPARESFLAEGLGPDSTDDESNAPSIVARTPGCATPSPMPARARGLTGQSLQRMSSSLEARGDSESPPKLDERVAARLQGQSLPSSRLRRDSEADGTAAGVSVTSPTIPRGLQRMDSIGKGSKPRPAALGDAFQPGSSLPRRGPEDAPLPGADPMGTPRSQQRVRFPPEASSESLPQSKLESLLHRFRDRKKLTLSKEKRKASRQSLAAEIPDTDDRPSTPMVNAEKPFSSEPVGLSRLYMVEFPNFEMKPLYWDRTADKARVCRGTWFYRATMRPVRQDLANQLEFGYNSIKPWTETYDDEVKSCLSIGVEAEAKIVFKATMQAAEDSHGTADPRDDEESIRDLSWKRLSVGAVGDPGLKEETDKRIPSKRFVIFADAKNAQILSSSQLPSGKRKVLGLIRDGKTVGVPVVRGFEEASWERLNMTKQELARKAVHAKAAANRQEAEGAAEQDKTCIACQARKEESKVSDLVLVVHGIGQKYSKKSENWRFMHAMNDLRAEVRKIQRQPDMQLLFRRDLGQIMILPVEWRTKFSPEGESSEDFDAIEDDMRSGGSAGYKLADVTPQTIPNVREIINDVMVDIPYYMSDHREDMEQAMVHEANRIYRLFCRHNPGFVDAGRVHIVAHSLGTVMVLSALSRQPTHVPSATPDPKAPLSTRHFDFDTANAFFCGSPAGFFLLLHRANLLPRRGRAKPGCGAARADVGGEAGRYGCVAADNVYNVIHRTDAVAYRMNACVDAHYTALLRDAVLPADRGGWLGALWGRRGPPPLHRAAGAPSGGGTGTGNADNVNVRPKLGSLPSTVEMEEHQFHREERAERKMRHLNDNGQVDWYIQGSGGAFEYLNILSAHSSYWTTPEFIRFLVVEVGREPGPQGTIAQLTAVKKNPWKRGNPTGGPV